MRTELISIPTPAQPLDGAFYSTADAGGSVQLFHGATMNFHVGPRDSYPRVLTERRWNCLAYNRRAHDVLSTRASRDPEGGAHETNATSLEDDELARAWLIERTGQVPVAIGHSHGGMLAAAHVAAHPDTPALVLMSAHRGGKDIGPLAAVGGLLAGDRTDEMLAEARVLVAQGRGDQLMLTEGWWNVISAASYIDFNTNCPDVIESAARITCPVLYIVGEGEPEARYPMTAFAEACAGPVETLRIPECGHFYAGFEDQVARTVAGWLDGAELATG
ncbi:alpha/beta fold hydrolase [bacterium]|nr:alpha/beta fold hydrolase [bacterium]